MQQRAAAGKTFDINTCNSDFGWPLAGMVSEPIKIVQAPKEMMILYEAGNLHLQIFTDGRVFPDEFELPAYLGYSVGRWENDTFVVETRGFRRPGSESHAAGPAASARRARPPITRLRTPR